MGELRIYTFYNEIRNCNEGEWFFCAYDETHAKKLAQQFADKFNQGKNRNYILEFKTPVKETRVKEGFLSLNRSEIL